MQDLSNNKTNGLRQRLDALFEKKLFTNSVVVENFKGKKKKKKGSGKKKKKNKTKKKSGKSVLQDDFGFKRVTWKSLTTGRGWRNLFNILFFSIPALIMFLADRIVNIGILRSGKYDPKNDEKYRKFKENDRLWIYNSGIEFFQIFIAAYIASSLYHMIFIEQHRDMETYFKSDVEPEIGIDVYKYLLFGLTFLPRIFYFVIYKTAFKPLERNSKGEVYKTDTKAPLELDFSNPFGIFQKIFNDQKEKELGATPTTIEPLHLEGFKDFLPYTKYRTVVYLLFYCFSFFICSFLLSKIARLFLDVFIFKANPIMYMFILFGFLQWALEVVAKSHISIKIDADSQETIKVPNPKLYYMFSLMYLIYLILHILFALGCAPIAQAVFTIYLLSFFVDSKKIFTYDILTNAGVFIGHIYSGSMVESDLDEKFENSSSTNSFFHTSIFKNNSLMFSFLFMLFFFWKFLTTFIPGVKLQIIGLQSSFAIINILVFTVCAICYYYCLNPISHYN